MILWTFGMSVKYTSSAFNPTNLVILHLFPLFSPECSPLSGHTLSHLGYIAASQKSRLLRAESSHANDKSSVWVPLRSWIWWGKCWLDYRGRDPIIVSAEALRLRVKALQSLTAEICNFTPVQNTAKVMEHIEFVKLFVCSEKCPRPTVSDVTHATKDRYNLTDL